MGGQDTFDFPPKSDPVELTATAVRNLCLLRYRYSRCTPPPPAKRTTNIRQEDGMCWCK